jgi:bacteriorhodopsin
MKFFVFFLLLGIFFFFPGIGNAASTLDIVIEKSVGTFPYSIAFLPEITEGATATEKVGIIFFSFVNFVLYAIGIGAVVMIVYAGFRLTVSVGSEESITHARKTILYAVLGLLAIFFSLTIIRNITDFFY